MCGTCKVRIWSCLRQFMTTKRFLKYHRKYPNIFEDINNLDSETIIYITNDARKYILKKFLTCYEYNNDYEEWDTYKEEQSKDISLWIEANHEISKGNYDLAYDIYFEF